MAEAQGIAELMEGQQQSGAAERQTSSIAVTVTVTGAGQQPYVAPNAELKPSTAPFHGCMCGCQSGGGAGAGG
jgi:hypothetical protein